MEKYGVDPEELSEDAKGYEDIAAADCYKDIAEAARKKKRPKRVEKPAGEPSEEEQK